MPSKQVHSKPKSNNNQQPTEQINSKKRKFEDIEDVPLTVSFSTSASNNKKPRKEFKTSTPVPVVAAVEEEKTKKQEKKEENDNIAEKIIEAREKELQSETLLPQTDEEFERLLVANPTSSYLWIQFIAFKCAQYDIETARKLGKRGLKVIPSEKAQEKFNLYAALMNLESKFGTTESQKTIFDEALKYCDEKKVLLQQARILETQAETNFKTGGKASISNDKKSKEQSIKESSTENIYQKQLNSKKVSETFKGADEMYGKCLKKFPNDMQCLKKYFSFLIEKGLFSKAEKTLMNMMKAMKKRDQVMAITLLASTHYKKGSLSEGSKFFEQILADSPNKTDTWSLYIELETSKRRVFQAKQLFDRVVHLNLPAKRMKKFLQKYMKFAQDFGTKEDEETVKKIAKEFVERKMRNGNLNSNENENENENE